jgi:hypothetical protein
MALTDLSGLKHSIALSAFSREQFNFRQGIEFSEMTAVPASSTRLNERWYCGSLATVCRHCAEKFRVRASTFSIGESFINSETINGEKIGIRILCT